MADDLRQENERLKKELAEFQQKYDQALKKCAANVRTEANAEDSGQLPGPEAHVSIVVLGASGDLAKKKTFPSVFALYALDLLPKNFTVYGFARSKMSDEEFRKDHVGKNCKGNDDKKNEFLSRCFYFAGQYNSADDLAKLSKQIQDKEKSSSQGHRVFYMAVPPSIFVDVAKALRHGAMARNGWTRVIVEKPFGRDTETSAQLSEQLGALFQENQIYRIDHYLGKEMVQNLMVTRFANTVWEPLWSRYHISSVSITFKEDIGTEGRGGYFDEFGIIRDVMQNHLLQIFALVAMEPPVDLTAEYIRDEKVKVLRATETIKFEDVVVGQYTGDAQGKQQGYLEDPTVPKGSTTPTYAVAVLHINNTRWKGVPFILKCGKALNERKTEVRIQFQDPATNHMFYDPPRNELVIRVQPDEAVYMKFNAKNPGLEGDTQSVVQTELDLTYKKRFDVRLPDAYERLIYDVLRGDHNLFVRVDELEAAWRIFTPVLHKLEKEKIKPIPYAFGSRGPTQGDEIAAKYGFIRSENYSWNPKA